MTLITEFPAETLILLFLIVTFIQSGIDKVLDWKGNVSFITEHFKNSPLQNGVPFLLAIILVTEIVAGILMIIGLYQLAISGNSAMALYGVALSGLTLIFLLVGQRLAKDYAGAMSLAVYFIICIFGVYLLK